MQVQILCRPSRNCALRHRRRGRKGRNEISEVKATKVGIGLNDLRIVDDEIEEEELPDEEEGDSDDEVEAPDAKPKLPPDDEMTSTALNLLLSILEGQFVASHWDLSY